MRRDKKIKQVLERLTESRPNFHGEKQAGTKNWSLPKDVMQCIFKQLIQAYTV